MSTLALPFRTKAGYYIYDTNSNEILRMEGKAFIDATDYLLPRHQSSSDAPSVPQSIAHLIEEGYLRKRPLPAMGMPACSHHIAQQVDKELQQLVLEVTTGCNLRCRYCVYSGRYPGHRRHGNERMSKGTAYRGIDYLLEHGVNTDYAALGFYGGEPFLNFRLIESATDYLRTKTNRPVLVSITTNATTLDARIIEWCIREQASLLVSLDGNLEGHDRNRRTASGAGTWDVVTRTLKTIRQQDEEYYVRHIGLNCVLAIDSSPLAASGFFSSPWFEDEIGAVRITCTAENRIGALLTEQRAIAMDNRALRRFGTEISALKQKYINGIISGEVADSPEYRFERALFDATFLKIYRRDPLPPSCRNPIPLNGMCIPAVRKLFVSADGTLGPCERVNRSFPLGSVHTGLEPGRVEELLGDYRRYSERRCQRCWAARLCPGCAASVAGPMGFDHAVARRFCRTTRSALLENLQVFCNVLEVAPTGFDYLESYRSDERRGSTRTDPNPDVPCCECEESALVTNEHSQGCPPGEV